MATGSSLRHFGLECARRLHVVTTTFKRSSCPRRCSFSCACSARQRFGPEHRIAAHSGRSFCLVQIVIATLGSRCRSRAIPASSAALDPLYAVRFMDHSGARIPGARRRVFCAITRREALYADMVISGRLDPLLRGRRPSQSCYRCFGAKRRHDCVFLIDEVDGHGQPVFFKLRPSGRSILWCAGNAGHHHLHQASAPARILLTRQAMQLGWLPGVAIRQTSGSSLLFISLFRWSNWLSDDSHDRKTTMVFGASTACRCLRHRGSTTMRLTTILL